MRLGTVREHWLLSAVVILILFQKSVVQIKHEIELSDSCIEIAEIVCRERYMLITELLCIRQVLPLLGA